MGYEIIKSITDLVCKTFIDEGLLNVEDLTKNIAYSQATRMYEHQ